MKRLNNLFSSQKARLAAGIVGALILALLIFHAGIVVGYHRASSYPQRENHGFRSSFLPGGLELPHGFIPNTHGAIGTVTAVTLPTFLMETRDGASRTIRIATSTTIRGAGAADLKSVSPGDTVIVLGEPDGQEVIDARAVRILSSSTTTP